MTNLELILKKYNVVTLNMHQVADILNMTYMTALKKVNRNAFPVPIKKVGGKWLANTVDVARFLDERNA